MTTADSRATRRVLEDLFGPAEERPFNVRFGEGGVDRGRPDARFTLVLNHAGALRRMLVPPTELSIIESYLFNDVDIEGDLEAAARLGDLVASRLASTRDVLRVMRHVTALPKYDRPEPGSSRAARALQRFGRQHSRHRDRRAVQFHYDLGNDFFALFLDRRMVYSCAYFENGSDDLDHAQVAKLDYVCRKLRLRPGDRFLDVGCGWGALVMHAAERYGVNAVGITLSERQAAFARERIVAAGLSDRCRVELRDYRTLVDDAPFDKAASIGMVEHVGSRKLRHYFAAVLRALKPGGLFLNHGIVTIGGARPKAVATRVMDRVWRRNAFIERYVFPDGVLVPAASVIASAEHAGFELRDVESLREHYTQTLRHWVHRLEAQHERAVTFVGEFTYRVWRLYMSGSAYAFDTGRIGVIQTLLAKQGPAGAVSLPRTRRDLYDERGRD